MSTKSYDSSEYARIGQSIGALVTEKQAAYGDSFGKSGQVLRLLYPDGITPEKLDDALTVVRVVDKLFRIATARDAFGESPWRDVAGYSLLSIERQERAATARGRCKVCQKPTLGGVDVCGACEDECRHRAADASRCEHEFGDAFCSKCGAKLAGETCRDFDNRGDGICRRCSKGGKDHHA